MFVAIRKKTLKRCEMFPLRLESGIRASEPCLTVFVFGSRSRDTLLESQHTRFVRGSLGTQSQVVFFMCLDLNHTSLDSGEI